MGWKLVKDYKFFLGGGKARMLETLKALRQKTSYAVKPMKPTAPHGYKYEWHSDREAKSITPQSQSQTQAPKPSSIWFKK